MNSILKVKRVKINVNLQTVYSYKTDLRIDLDSDYPTRWESYEFETKANTFLFTKVSLAGGGSFLLDMVIDEWESFYMKKKEEYEKENPPPILPN